MNLLSGEIRPPLEIPFREPTGIGFPSPVSSMRTIPLGNSDSKYFPSGDQERGMYGIALKTWLLELSWTSMMRTDTVRKLRNARLFPSGDQAGDTSAPCSKVTREEDFLVRSVT